MKAAQIMIEHLARKRRILLLESEEMHLKKLDIIRVTNYSDDAGSKGVDLDERIWKLSERRRIVNIDLLKEKMHYDSVEKVLELLAETHPHGRNAIEMYYLRNKKMPMIASEIGFSVSHSWKILHDAEEEFEKIYNLLIINKK